MRARNRGGKSTDQSDWSDISPVTRNRWSVFESFSQIQQIDLRYGQEPFGRTTVDLTTKRSRCPVHGLRRRRLHVTMCLQGIGIVGRAALSHGFCVGIDWLQIVCDGSRTNLSDFLSPATGSKIFKCQLEYLLFRAGFFFLQPTNINQIGRASCRERVLNLV